MLQIDTSESGAKLWRILLLRGAIAVVLGIVLFVWTSSSIRVLLVVFVSYALVDGIVSLVAAVRSARAGEAWTRPAIEAAIALIAAAVVWAWPHIVLSTLGYLIGIAMIARGVAQLLGAAQAQASVRTWLIVAGILSLIAGCIFVFSPRNGLYLFIWTLAVYGLTFGTILIVLGLRARKLLGPAQNA